jgi:anti-sigma B factor antagonist
MTVNIERNYESVTLGISGRLDTATAPNLEKIINEFPEDIKEIVFDMFRVDYISSAGIRVLLGAYKKMNLNHGTMRIEKANELIREVFEMTGLSEMLG